MELPVFDLERATQVSDNDFAEMLDGNTRFVGNLSKFASSNPDRWKHIRSLRAKVGESREQLAERCRREAVVHQPETPLTPAEEIALASDITAYPCERCRQIFATGANAEAAKLFQENPTEYARAKSAAQFFGIVGKDSTATVRFNYERPIEHRERIAKPVEPDALPAGVEKSKDGIGYVVVDPKAYAEWQKLQAAKKTIAGAEMR
jgi:hypothetical protein